MTIEALRHQQQVDELKARVKELEGAEYLGRSLSVDPQRLKAERDGAIARVRELEEQHAHRDKVNAEKREQWEALNQKLAMVETQRARLFEMQNAAIDLAKQNVTLTAERDGAIAEAAATKRERDRLRLQLELETAALEQACGDANAERSMVQKLIAVERDFCAQVADEIERICPGHGRAVAEAIRARGQQRPESGLRK